MRITVKVFFFVMAIAVFSTARGSNMTVTRTPDGGIQPQVAVDSTGTAHLIFFKGADGGGDIFYARQKADEDKFSKPVRVNSRPGSAMAIGTIRGAQLAIGKK